MKSKKQLRREAIEREEQRRYQEAIEACPISREEYEKLVEHVSDHVVEHGHSNDWRETTSFLQSQSHPVEATLAFLNARGILDDWSLLVEGDSCKFFGPTAVRGARMPLEEQELTELLEWIDNEVQMQGCDHTHKLTRSWLREHEKPEVRIVGALMAQGGFCDCEVAMNVEPEGIYPENSNA